MRMKEYVLGSSDHELERLALQQEVWAANTARFLDALELRPGMRALDLGCGPGFVVEMLRERVGPGGHVLGLDASRRWVDHLRAKAEREGWSDVSVQQGRIEDLEVDGTFDLIFLRWVLAFLPERQATVEGLARLLAPGGTLAVMDYNHEGVSLFPQSRGFQAAVQATRDLYTKTCGDTWIMGSITRLFRAAGLTPSAFEPFVIAGSPGSPAFRWADAFFPFHTVGMVEAGVLSAADRELFLSEWNERRQDPDALFFSPIVVGAAARKP